MIDIVMMSTYLFLRLHQLPPCLGINQSFSRWHAYKVRHNTFINDSNMQNLLSEVLTLKVLVATIDAQWEGMGDVGSARYELALLPLCRTIRVLSYSN